MNMVSCALMEAGLDHLNIRLCRLHKPSSSGRLEPTGFSSCSIPFSVLTLQGDLDMTDRRACVLVGENETQGSLESSMHKTSLKNAPCTER